MKLLILIILLVGVISPAKAMDGCGPYGHRNWQGYCAPNVSNHWQGNYRRDYRSCPYGYHLSRSGERCWPN